MALQNEPKPRLFGDLFAPGYWESEAVNYSKPAAGAGRLLDLDVLSGLQNQMDILMEDWQELKRLNSGKSNKNLESNCELNYGQHFTEQCPLLDSYFQDQHSNRMSDYSQQPFQSSNQWSSYSQGDNYVACNPPPCTFSGGFERKWVESRIGNSFEDTVMQKLDALQAQMNKMAQTNDEEFLRTWTRTQTTVGLSEKCLESRFVEHLEAYEERSIKRFEEYSKKMSSMIERLESQKRENLKEIQKKFEDLQFDSRSILLQLINLEDRMGNEMGQLFTGMFKAQGRLDESESDDDGFEDQDLKELPVYFEETIFFEDYGNESVERGCGSTPLRPCKSNEEERISCEEIASFKNDVPTTKAVHEHWMNLEDIREEDYMACSPVEERNYSIGAELPLHQEDTSFSSLIMPCYSCEIVGAPQVNACFGVIASSASGKKSHEEASWEDKDSMVDLEVPKNTCKTKRRVAAQVWIPRGTLEVMKVFHMTEINLGEKSCVPHKAKKRKRRGKSPNPQGGIG